MKTEESHGEQMSTENVRKRERTGLKTLRKYNFLQGIRSFYGFNYYRGSGLGAFRSPEMSIQERFLVQKEEKLHTKI